MINNWVSHDNCDIEYYRPWKNRTILITRNKSRIWRSTRHCRSLVIAPLVNHSLHTLSRKSAFFRARAGKKEATATLYSNDFIKIQFEVDLLLKIIILLTRVRDTLSWSKIVFVYWISWILIAITTFEPHE